MGWREAGACFDTDSIPFFPQTSHGRYGRVPKGAAEAAVICGGCKVRLECGAFVEGLPPGEREGIWGGAWYRGKRKVALL